MKSKLNLFDLLFRYSLILLLGIGNIFLLSIILTPATIYSLFFLLSLVYSQITLSGNLILLNSYTIEIISACVAVSAYYLLIVLNLSTPMPLKTRIYSLFCSLIALFTINILRLFILAIFFVNSFAFFDLIHKVFWYGLSTIFILIIWFSLVKLFNIKEMPIYSDLKKLTKLIKNRTS